MTQVVDSSVVASALLGIDEHQEWADSMLVEGALVVPALLHFEVANIIRRSTVIGATDETAASVALARLALMPVRHVVPFTRVADRAWELRANLTTYDASYVAAAELFDCRLVTLDHRLARATGPRCEIVTPPSR